MLDDGGDHLYVISSPSFPGMVKIGRSNCPERRRLDLSNGQPVQYELMRIFHGGGKYERAVHKHLADKRHTAGHSKEWFCVDADEVVEAYRAVTYPVIMDHLETLGYQVSTYEDVLRRAERAEAELRRRDQQQKEENPQCT